MSGLLTDVRPDNKGPATRVKMGLRIIDVQEIDDVDQTITLDFALRLTWVDERLSPFAGCRVPVARIWFPDLVLVNSGRLFNRWPDEVSIGKGGLATYQQRKSGTFSSYHELLDFPYDQQSINVTIFPLNWSEQKVMLERDEQFEGIISALNISDWQVSSVSSEVLVFEPNALAAPRSAYKFTIKAERYISYYVWKIIVPICLIVVMSWSVFWIEAREFGTQLGLSATSVLTIVAFIFATTNMLPRLGYFTLLDRFIAGSTVLVFLASLQSLTTGYLATRGNEATARQIDRASRYLFPASFALFCAWTFAPAV